MTTNRKLTADEAIQNAAAGADLKNADYRCVSVIHRGGYYEIILQTLFLKYEFYVDDTTGETAGLNTEPLPASDCFDLRSGICEGAA